MTSAYTSPSTWRKIRRWEGWEFLIGFVLIIAAAAIFFTVLFGGINLWARSLDRNTCEKWQETSGYTVRWQDNSFWSYDCMAKTASGKWLPIDQLRDVDQ